MAWPMAVLGIGGASGAGLGLRATERPATGPEGASARPHPRWAPVARRDWQIPTFGGGEHRSCGRRWEQAPPADSAASARAVVLVRYHERCGYGRAPTRWPGGSGAFARVVATPAD